MNSIKKTILTIGVLAGGMAMAQNASMTNMLKVGVNGGVSTGGNTSANVGVDLAYQNLVSPGFGLGIATGYNHFFGKSTTINNVSIDNNDVGMIPVAALIRIYPQQYGFYLGADLGYGFLVGEENVVKNNVSAVQRPDGGFYMRPEIGYHNKDWNFYAHYTKVFTGDNGKVGDQKYNVGTIGAGVSYNLPLGK